MKGYRTTLAAFSLLVGLLLLVPAAAGAQSSSPPINGAMQPATTMTKSANLISYQIVMSDTDTNASNQPVTDYTCTLKPLNITSFQGTQWQWVLSSQQNGTFTWTASGRVVSTPGAYVDSWKLFNDRLTGDPYLDNPLNLGETVIINPPI